MFQPWGLGLHDVTSAAMPVDPSLEDRIDVWHGKRPKAGNGKKMEIEMENGPKLDRGKKWQKNGPKMDF